MIINEINQSHVPPIAAFSGPSTRPALRARRRHPCRQAQTPSLHRPIDPKRPLHVVMRATQARGPRSLLARANVSRVDTLLHRYARRFQVRVLTYSNVGNHLHLLIQGRTRGGLQSFLRVLPGQIAQAITGARPQEREALPRQERPRGVGSRHARRNGSDVRATTFDPTIRDLGRPRCKSRLYELSSGNPVAGSLKGALRTPLHALGNWSGFPLELEKQGPAWHPLSWQDRRHSESVPWILLVLENRDGRRGSEWTNPLPEEAREI